MERADRTPAVARFFTGDGLLEPRVQLTLGDAIARHLRVRRLGAGAVIELLDGLGRRGTGLIVRTSKDSTTVEIGEVEMTPPPPPVHLLVPVADRDRMLWLAEKATEVGITTWRPVLWKRSRSVSHRGEGPVFAARVRARMVGALEQSGGAYLPQIFPEATSERAMAAVSPSGTRILLDPGGSSVFALTLVAPVTLALGPEGGFEPGEHAELSAAGFQPASLGPGLMRFETAGAVGAAIARALTNHQDGASHGN